MFCFAGILVRYRRTGKYQTEIKAGCGMALETSRVIYQNGYSAT
jgi:hypothetical protein